MNSANPYPHTFLFTVIATISEPATGLYESTLYVVAIAGKAATWMPAQVYPMITMASHGHLRS